MSLSDIVSCTAGKVVAAAMHRYDHIGAER
jgi:hypothetical protein